MRGSGYSEPATSEVLAALGILAKYGVLGLGVGLSHTNGTHSHSTPTAISYLGVSGLEQPTSVASSGVFGAIGQVNLDSYMSATSPTPRTSLERYDTTAFDPFRHAGQQAATPISINTNNFGLATSTAIGAAASAAQTLGALSKSPTPGDVSLRDTKNVEIPEVIVGAILGEQFEIEIKVIRLDRKLKSFQCIRELLQIEAIADQAYCDNISFSYKYRYILQFMNNDLLILLANNEYSIDSNIRFKVVQNASCFTPVCAILTLQTQL